MTTRDEAQDRRLQRIEQSFALPETAQGAEQRLRMHVPTHHSQVALGARGTKDTVGPPGIAAFTEASVALQAVQDGVVDTGGNLITHSAGKSSFVSEQDLSVGSNHGLFIGAVRSIELTAGGAGFTDPAYSRSASVPAPPPVNTAGPRAPTEADNRNHAGLWGALDSLTSTSSLWGLRKGLTSGVAAGSFLGRVNALLGLARSFESLYEGAYNALHAAAELFDIPGDAQPSHPSIKLHGEGGVGITSPHKISAYAGEKISLSSSYKVSIKAGWSASMKSAGNVKLYGGASAQVQSAGVVGIKGKLISISGDLAEMKAAQMVAINSKRLVHVESDDAVMIDAPTVGIAGDNSFLDAKVAANVHAVERATLTSDREAEVRSRGTARVEGDGGAALVCRDNGVSVTDNQVGLSVGSTHMTLEADRLRLFRIDVQRQEVHMRGEVYLG